MRNRFKKGLLTRIAAAAAVGSMVVVAVPMAATPAQAQGVCVAQSRAALWENVFSVQLMRTSNCYYYAKLTIDDGTWGVGAKITWKVERQEKTPYGWFVTDTKSSSRYWSAGHWNTGSVDGWYPTAWEGTDNHRACYQLNTSGWSCTEWMGI